MELTPHFFNYFLVLCGVLSSIYLVGHLVLGCFPQDMFSSYERLFFKLTLGCFLLVCGYATIRTGFRSILMGMWMVLGLFSWYQRKKVVSVTGYIGNLRQTELVPIVIYLSYALLIYGYLYFMSVANIYGETVNTHVDYIFWAGVVSNLNILGVESNIVEPGFLIQQETARFYHYFELWMAAGVAKSFHANSLFSLILVTNTILMSLSVLGARAITDNILTNKKVAGYLLAITVLFIISYHYMPLQRSPVVIAMGVLQSNGGVKLAGVLTLLMWSGLTCLRGRLAVRLLPIALIIYVYPIVFPVVSISALIFLLITQVWCNNINRNELREAWVLMGASISFMIVFYACNHLAEAHANGQVEKSVAALSMGEILIKIGLVKSACYSGLHLFKGLLLSIIHVAPFLIMARYVWKSGKAKWDNNFKLCGVFLLVLYGTAFSTECIFYRITDYSQIMVSILGPMTAVLAFITLCLWVSELKRLTVFTVLILVFLLPWMTSVKNTVTLQRIFRHTTDTIVLAGPARRDVDQQDCETLRQLVGNRNIRVAYEMDPKEFADGSIYSMNFYTHIPFKNIRRFNNYYFPVCISVADFPSMLSFEQQWTLDQLVSNSAFFRYLVRTKMMDQVDLAKTKFLKEYLFEYLIVPATDKEWEKGERIPVSRVITFNREPYKILELNWCNPLRVMSP